MRAPSSLNTQNYERTMPSPWSRTQVLCVVTNRVQIVRLSTLGQARQRHVVPISCADLFHVDLQVLGVIAEYPERLRLLLSAVRVCPNSPEFCSGRSTGHRAAVSFNKA